MIVLGINFSHDGAACITADGRLCAFICTERHSRIKKQTGIRLEDLHLLLSRASLSLREIECVVLANHRLFGNEEMIAVYGSNQEESWFPFSLSPARDSITVEGVTIPAVYNPPHHLLHASLAYFTSPYDGATIWSWDPTGQGAFIGEGVRIRRLDGTGPPWERRLWCGTVYGHASASQFGTATFGAGKLMGLAPYGITGSTSRAHLLPPYSLTASNHFEVFNQLRERSASGPFLHKGEAEGYWNAGLAALAQDFIEDALTKILTELSQELAKGDAGESPRSNLILTGGTALNSVANQVSFERSAFRSLYLHPACGDDGTALGAALWYTHHVKGLPRHTWSDAERMYNPATYTESSLRAALHDLGGDGVSSKLICETRADWAEDTAAALASGEVVGWFIGGSEIGPRALGHRSILADPRVASMKDRINLRVKRREYYRPFAPAVRQENAAEWFSVADSPFMLRVAKVLRDEIPAVTHIDGTARVQTVSQQCSPEFHSVLTEFMRRTDVPVLLNTSFNVRGEPVVETPHDAVRSLLSTELDSLTFKGFRIRRRTQ